MDATTRLNKLLEGNVRYVDGRLNPHELLQRRTELVQGQHPMATVLTCSDSRVVPEFIFDTGLGDLFTVISAGNVVDRIGLGSIEYGVEHLHTPLLIVIGHQKCGAVSAAYENHQEGHITDIVRMIQPAVARVKKGGDKTAEIEQVVVENVKDVIAHIQKNSTIVARLVAENKLKIVGMKYSLETGRVERVA